MRPCKAGNDIKGLFLSIRFSAHVLGLLYRKEHGGGNTRSGYKQESQTGQGDRCSYTCQISTETWNPTWADGSGNLFQLVYGVKAVPRGFILWSSGRRFQFVTEFWFLVLISPQLLPLHFDIFHSPCKWRGSLWGEALWYVPGLAITGQGLWSGPGPRSRVSLEG